MDTGGKDHDQEGEGGMWYLLQVPPSSVPKIT